MSNQAVNLADLKGVAKKTAQEAGGKTVQAYFESQKSALAAVLPKHVNPDRMLRLAMTALRTTPKLQQCEVASLFGAVAQCSALGLEPNTPLGHAYLIPFEKRRKQGNTWVTVGTEVQIIFGYKGLIDLARRSGQIVSISAHEVCEGDKFDFAYGLNERLDHIPTTGQRGAVTHFYAVAKLVGGGYAFEVMSVAQVEEIRDKTAKGKNPDGTPKISDVWRDHFVEMGRKTVLRRLFKYLPISIELATAAQIDGKAGHEDQNLGDVLTGSFEVVENPYASNEQEQEPAQQAVEHEQAESVNTLTGEIEQQAEPVEAAQESTQNQRRANRRNLAVE